MGGHGPGPDAPPPERGRPDEQSVQPHGTRHAPPGRRVVPGLITAGLLASALGDQGIALASPVLFARELEAGLLVQPVPLSVKLIPDYAYWLVWPEGRRRSPKIARFRDWIMAAAEADPAVRAARDAVEAG